MDKRFKKFSDNIHFAKKKRTNSKKKGLFLVLPYLGVTYLQSRSKLQQAF